MKYTLRHHINMVTLFEQVDMCVKLDVHFTLNLTDSKIQSLGYSLCSKIQVQTGGRMLDSICLCDIHVFNWKRKL